MTTNETKKIPEFKPVKKLSPFVGDPHNHRGGKSGVKGSGAGMNSVGVRKSNVQSNIKKGGGGDR